MSIELVEESDPYCAFSIGSLEDLGPELMVAWDRDLVEEMPHPGLPLRLTLHVGRRPSFRPHGLFLFNHGDCAAIYSYDLQRWFPRRVDMRTTEEDVMDAVRAAGVPA